MNYFWPSSLSWTNILRANPFLGRPVVTITIAVIATILLNIIKDYQHHHLGQIQRLLPMPTLSYRKYCWKTCSVDLRPSEAWRGWGSLQPRWHNFTFFEKHISPLYYHLHPHHHYYHDHHDDVHNLCSSMFIPSKDLVQILPHGLHVPRRGPSTNSAHLSICWSWSSSCV